MTAIAALYTDATGWIFEHALQPLLYALELMDWAEDAYAWLDFALFGLFGIAVAWAVCRPLEAWRPVEPVSRRGAVRTDMLYTFLNRLGVLPLLAFVFLASVQAAWEGWLTEAGLLPPTLEELVPLLREHPVLAFAAYVVILDFGEYWRHRAQHAFRWWWALHAIHHAQRQMTFWTDDRNHVLDDVIAALWFGGIALLIGVPPGQFPVIVLVLRLAREPVPCECPAGLWPGGGAAAGLAAFPPAASRAAFGRGAWAELRRAAARLGLGFRDRRFPPRRLPTDWGAGGAGSPGKRRLAAAAGGRAAADGGGNRRAVGSPASLAEGAAT
ncbi:sterol desaturase family protein [Dankookia sp. P2]|uniref:sterol desaturase family protein n=1 Tax=Dankookia sp. P2 TaxID=3423955 RepID=UPI003D66691B